MTSRNQTLFELSQRVIPGGVNSPVRAFKSVGGTPVFFQRALGSRAWDLDDKEYIDYVGSWGPLVLGHAHPEVIAAVREAAANGLSFGAPTEAEYEMAAMLCKLLPSLEMVRLVSSGTEATMTAIRLARGFTGRNKIIKFEGCYHGHADALLVKAGSGALTFGQPSSAGVPPEVVAHTLALDFNDIEGVARAFQRDGGDIAAVIVEPVAGNMGCVPPAAGFLEGLRLLCTERNAVLIFDEVMTGFRVSRGGAQELYRVTPDLTTLGKIIGGGLPVGAYGGKKEIMELVAPQGPMYQAGTLSGNPLAMAAGHEMLSRLSHSKSIYAAIERRAAQLEKGIREILHRLSLPYRLNRVGSMFTLFFTDRDVVDYASATTSDRTKFGAWLREMLSRGIYLPPSQFEAAFLSNAHTQKDIERTLSAARASLEQVSRGSP
jgi:glutamate-1-semialdehyde 2,1-aminomutase